LLVLGDTSSHVNDCINVHGGMADWVQSCSLAQKVTHVRRPL
jgi:hypothetical protein